MCIAPDGQNTSHGRRNEADQPQRGRAKARPRDADNDQLLLETALALGLAIKQVAHSRVRAKQPRPAPDGQHAKPGASNSMLLTSAHSPGSIIERML